MQRMDDRNLIVGARRAASATAAIAASTEAGREGIRRFLPAG
jgi:hypothetical protein